LRYQHAVHSVARDDQLDPRQERVLMAGMDKAVSKTSILETVAHATRLREGPSGVSALLRAVYRAGSLRLQDAAREARLPLPVASAVRRELEKVGLLERKHGLALTAEGRTFAEVELGLAAPLEASCPTCLGTGIVLPDILQPVLARLSAILAAAPDADVKRDQAPCTPATALRRALLMLNSGALEGRRVLLLGDDDSVSLAIGMLAAAMRLERLTRRLTVLDADPRWLTSLDEASRREGFSIEIIEHDLRHPLPPSLQRAFDVVETDPPYTLPGARLFLARGREALDSAQEGLCFLSFAHWPAPQMLQLQAVFAELGLAIRSVRPHFNQYRGAAVLGNAGQLIELVHVASSAADLPEWVGPLYTAEVNPRSRVYVCTRCGTEIELGENGAPETIELLKAQGCRNCGGETFRRR
jgi:N4-bis(aminopropyl)spermidine synthase